MSIGITGFNSTIVREFESLMPDGETIRIIQRDPLALNQMDLDRYLFCQGRLVGDSIINISRHDAAWTWYDNFLTIAKRCDQILAVNRRARICIIGSESGYAGSYDMAYAGAKAAMHLYIETKRLEYPGQQIVGIAPTIIFDSAMTQSRKDLEAVTARGGHRRRGEWLAPLDIAKLAHFALYVDSGNLCNTVLRMTGGTW